MSRRQRKLKDSLAPVLSEQKVLAAKLQHDLYAIKQEAERVAEIMYSAPQILEDLDRQFAEATSLTRTDTTFLFIAIGLQCLRQYVFANDKFRLSAKEGDNLVKKVVPKSWEDILLSSVPYDAIKRTDEYKQLAESTGLSGTTHRYRTLGHDPIMGWVFGTANILTDSLTKTDFVTTYSVKNMSIAGPYEGGTIGMFNQTMEVAQSDKWLLPVAVARQAIHFGSDYFTKQGLPIPLIASANNDLAKALVMKFNIDLYSVMRGAALSMLINSIVGITHGLFYDEEKDGRRDMYEVRTRKILSYSNVIASSSNIIYVAVNGALGNAGALRALDIGGLLVTICRLVSDYRYITQIKKEFLKREFYNMVMSPQA